MATHSSILAWRICMDRGTWWTVAHGIAELDTTEQLTLSLFTSGCWKCKFLDPIPDLLNQKH